MDETRGPAFEHGRGRFFGRGDVKMALLQLLSEKSMHGYEMIGVLEERSAGFYRPSPGSVYPTLQMLEELGYVEPVVQGRQKVYSITAEGRTYLAANQADPTEDGRHPMFPGSRRGPRGHHGFGPGGHRGFGLEELEGLGELRSRTRNAVDLLFHVGRLCAVEPTKREEYLEVLGGLVADLERLAGPETGRRPEDG